MAGYAIIRNMFKKGTYALAVITALMAAQAFLVPPAYSFKQTPVENATPGIVVSKNPSLANDLKVSKLATPNLKSPEEQIENAKGYEIHLPGIGSLGYLPKLDFGLELLYGANASPKIDELEKATPNDQLTVKGTVKHRF